MKTADLNYIIATVARTNVLPVISKCNTSCIFCSHRQNPDGLKVFRLPELTLKDFEIITDFLSPERKIIIGESATRIIEGEPLLYKDIEAVLAMVRRKYPSTALQLTTNGLLLDERLVDFMAGLTGLELNISVNCINPVKRRTILGLKENDDIVYKIQMLKGRLKFSGSCVYVPEIMDHNDMEDIVRVLDETGAENVRIFLPGYTSETAISKNLEGIFREVDEIVSELRGKYEIPIIIEPSFISNLKCEVEGVIKGSPAYIAGIRYGDIIKVIGEREPISRVDAFETAYRKSNPNVVVERDGKIFKVTLKKKRNSSPGFVMLYDISPHVLDDIKASAKRNNAHKLLIMASELGADVLKCLLQMEDLPFSYKIIPVANLFFGGTIKCAGLLTVHDVEKALDEYLKWGEKPELVLLPGIMFDYGMQDLMGRSKKELDRYGIPIEIV